MGRRSRTWLWTAAAVAAALVAAPLLMRHVRAAAPQPQPQPAAAASPAGEAAPSVKARSDADPKSDAKAKSHPGKTDKAAKSSDAAAPLTKDRADAAMAVVSDFMPGMAQKLEGLRDNNPDQFNLILHRLINHRIGYLMRLKTEDPDGYALSLDERKLEMSTYDLGRRVSRASGDDAAKLETQLRQKLHDLFAARIKGREHELSMLEQRLDALRAQLDQQKQQKQALIDKRYDELLASPPQSSDDQHGADVIAAYVGPQHKKKMSPPDSLTTDTPATNKTDPKKPDSGDSATKADPKTGGKTNGKTKSAGSHAALTNDQIEQMLLIIAQRRAKLADELRALRQRDPVQFRKAINAYAPRLRQLVIKRAMDPTGFDLQNREQALHDQAVKLARQIGGKEIKEATTVREQLRKVLEQQFDTRQQLLEHELTRLEARIDQARSDLDAQRADEDHFVNDRFKRLTRSHGK